MITVDVNALVKKSLSKKGYDGLWWPEEGCECFLENLMPCKKRFNPECKPGYKIPCFFGHIDPVIRPIKFPSDEYNREKNQWVIDEHYWKCPVCDAYQENPLYGVSWKINFHPGCISCGNSQIIYESELVNETE